MPGRRRKQITKDLKSNLAMAAQDIGMDGAIDEHGRPRTLAKQYLDAEPQRGPIWVYGAISAGLTFGVWLYATTIYVFGSLDTLQAAGMQEPVTLRFLGVSIEAQASEEFFGAGFSGFSWITLIAMILMFGLFSRAWRVLRRGQST